MSLHDDSVAAAVVPQMFAYYGTTVVYKVGGAGDGTSITGVLHEERTEETEVGDGRFIERRRRFTVSADDVATPGVADTVTFNSETWAVEDGSIEGTSGIAWDMTLVLKSEIEPVFRGHRRRL